MTKTDFNIVRYRSFSRYASLVDYSTFTVYRRLRMNAYVDAFLA